MKVLRLIEILQLVFRLGGAACHIEVKRRDAFQTPDFAGILLELLLEFIDCLVAIPGIFWSIYAGNALLGICGGQIEPRHGKIRIEANRILEVFDSEIILRAPIGLNALIQLIARPQPVASYPSQ